MLDNIRQKLADLIAPKLKERRILLERQSNTDELTGIANRRAYNFAEYQAERDLKVFVMIDGDNFGRVNKEVGTKVCDNAIILLANVIKLAAKLSNSNRIFRIGGDEFAVIVDTPEQAAALINFIEGFYSCEPIRFGEVRVGATCGYGLSLEKADRNMQMKKRAKKEINKTIQNT